MPDRRVLLEGLLLTLEGDGPGKSAAVATARQVLAGEKKPKMVLNAPRVSGLEVTKTISAIRSTLQEAEHKLKCPKCGYVNPASASKCKNCGHALGEARKAKFAKLDEGVLNADERKASATIKRKDKDGKTKYKFPIPDKGHAKAALSRINQSDLSDAEKAKVRAKAKAKLAEAETRADYPSKANCNLPHGKMAARGKRICPNCKAKLKLEEAQFDRARHPRGRGGRFRSIPTTLDDAAMAVQTAVEGSGSLPGGYRVKTAGYGDELALFSPSGERLTTVAAAGRSRGALDQVYAREIGAHIPADWGYSDEVEADEKKRQRAEAGERALQEALGHESLNRSPKKNWVERAGELPAAIQHMAKDIHEERGLPLDQAIPIAISQAKKLAPTHEKYAKAVAEWEALKAKNAGKKAAKKLSESEELDEAALGHLFHKADHPRGRGGQWIRKAGVKYDEGRAATGAALPGVHKTQREYMALTKARPDDPPEIAEARGRVRDLAARFAAGLKSDTSVDDAGDPTEPVTAYPGEFYDVDRAEAAELLDRLRVHEGRDPVNRRYWDRVALAEAATTTTDDKQGSVKAPTKEPKAKPTDVKRDPKESKPELESVGKRVMHLQNRLNEMGYDLTSDGKFGPKTAEAVKDFQRAAMVKDDGIVGPITTNALKQAPHGEHFRAANVDELQPGGTEPQGATVPGDTSAGAEKPQETNAEKRKRDDKKDAGGGAGVTINIGGTPVKLEEAWTDVARRAALIARRQHHHVGPEREGTFHALARVSGPGEHVEAPHPDWVGHRPGEFPGDHEPAEGERAHVMAENGQRVFGVMRRGRLIDDSGSAVRAAEGTRPKGVTSQDRYLAKTHREGVHDAAEFRRRVAMRRMREALVEASARGADRKVRAELKRLPDGTFAPKGQGETLKAGHLLALPRGGVMKLPGGVEVKKIDREAESSGQTGEAGHNFEVSKGSVELLYGRPEDALNGVQSVAAAADRKSGKPSKSEYSDISKFGAGGSPGRGPTGKLRNFEAMSPVKLKQTIADLEEFGKDAEALAAVKKVAEGKGLSHGDSKPKPASKPKPKPKADYGIKKGDGSDMAPNKGNLSLKDMPLGTTFEMNDGSQYKLHKSVNDPFYIVKPLDGGKAKPLHKMFAPPKVGGVAEGYSGTQLPSGEGVADPAAMQGPAADDLFGQLSKSVDVAAQAKAQGKQPDFAAAKTAMAPAPAAAPVQSPQQIALDAYVNAGGNDPNVIAILKKQLQESVELREDWAAWDAKRKLGRAGMGRSLAHRFEVDPSSHAEREALSVDAASHELRKIPRGKTMHIPLPEGSLRVTHNGGRGLRRGFEVSGGGHHSDPDKRRGTREILGTGATGREVAERMEHSIRADADHTVHYTGKVLAAREGTKTAVPAIEGDGGHVVRKGNKFISSAGGKTAEHDTADEAVRHVKKTQRAAGAKFLPEGHGTDPMEKKSLVDTTKASLVDRAKFHADEQRERIEKLNPEGFGGDFNPEVVEKVVGSNPLSATLLAKPEMHGLGHAEAAGKAHDVAAKLGHGPKTPGLGHHAAAVADQAHSAAAHALPHLASVAQHLPHLQHLFGLMHARIEREQEELRRLEEAGDVTGVLRARARLRVLRERAARA